MVNFDEFLTNFPWPTWLLAASNIIFMLATFHWLPWSFLTGDKLPRFWAYGTGCIAIIVSFGLWALIEGMPAAWLWLVLIILIFQYPTWIFFKFQRFYYILAYIISTLPVLGAFGAWAYYAGEFIALAGLVGLYGVGAFATIACNLIDKIGMGQTFGRINHIKH